MQLKLYCNRTATIIPGKSITITSEKGDVHFEIGDEAVYHTYNLIYTGTIRSITEKTVTIESYPGTINARRYRLPINRFASLNYDYNANRIAASNSDTMQYI